MPPDDLPGPTTTRILDAALNRAASIGWDSFHLHEVADDVGLSLVELARHVPDKHSLGQLLFDRADQSLLECANAPHWRKLPPTQRLELSLTAWFRALSPHREQVRQILRYQLQPDHVHLQIQGVLRVSRTVQWWREASCLPATGWKRELLEAALTGIYLSTVVYWLRDDSSDSSGTRQWLAGTLKVSSWAGKTLLRV